MATVFKNYLGTGIGTSSSPLFQTNSSATTTVIGLSITNTTSGIIQASIQLQDTIAGTTAYFIQNVTRVRDQQMFRLNFSYRFGKFDVNLLRRKSTKGDEGGGMDSMPPQ